MESELLRELDGKTLLVTGGTGLIGKWMIDRLLRETTCRILLLGRSEAKARERFPDSFGTDRLLFFAWNASRPIPLPPTIEQSEQSNNPNNPNNRTIDYILHLASNTHPAAYATDPVGTIVMNVQATQCLLDLAVQTRCRRFVYASSVEIYGENRGDTDSFREDYCGYLDSNTLRAGYPESKRCGEALCQAYRQQHGLDVVIPRLARVYGPTLLKSDTKALSQFLADALAGRDIVLKSEGRQFYSYLHVADAVSGILTVLLRGTDGEAYNVADPRSDIRLAELAELVAGQCGRKVVFQLPNAVESAGFSKATVARLDSTRLQKLGWKADYDIACGIAETIRALMRG